MECLGGPDPPCHCPLNDKLIASPLIILLLEGTCIHGRCIEIRRIHVIVTDEGWETRRQLIHAWENKTSGVQ